MTPTYSTSHLNEVLIYLCPSVSIGGSLFLCVPHPVANRYTCKLRVLSVSKQSPGNKDENLDVECSWASSY